MVALVTGASSGIGRDIAIELAKRKYDIIAVARNEEALIKLKEEVEKTYNVKVEVKAMDLTDRNGCIKLHEDVKAKYGGQIRTPDLEGKQYIGIYEEVLPETENKTENVPEAEIVSRAEEETDPPDLLRTSLAERIIEWLESHVTTITVSIGILFFLAAGIWLFVKTGKKPGRQSP